MGKLKDFLAANQLMVLDGALATELEAKGYLLKDKLWSAKVLVEHPEAIEQVHYEYFCAGAECAMTASYQATIDGFLEKGYSESEASAFIVRSVQLAKQARDRFWNENSDPQKRYPLIVATVGPYGAYLADGSEYRGDYPAEEGYLTAFHKKRIDLLVEAGVDVVALETLPNLQEAQILLNIMRAYPDVDCWVSFTCKNDEVISDNTAIEVAAAAVAVHPQVVAVGVNCTPPQYIEEVTKKMHRASHKPVAVYPNSGELYDPVRKIWIGTEENHALQAACESWYRAGARLIGGCCRTTPQSIREIFAWASAKREEA